MKQEGNETMNLEYGCEYSRLPVVTRGEGFQSMSNNVKKRTRDQGGTCSTQRTQRTQPNQIDR